MCMLCVEIQKQTMTSREVARAYHETTVDAEHFDELLREINKHYDATEISEELSELIREWAD